MSSKDIFLSINLKPSLLYSLKAIFRFNGSALRQATSHFCSFRTSNPIFIILVAMPLPLICSATQAPTAPPTTTAPPIVSRQLRRRVWDDSNIDFGTLKISGTPLEDKLLASSIAGLTFRAFQGDNPEQLEVTVVGWGWDSSRRKGVTSSVTSEVIFRGDIEPQIP